MVGSSHDVGMTCGYALQLSQRSRSKPGTSLAGLLTYASTSLNGLPRKLLPVASSRLPSSQRLQLRGSDGFAPSSRTPDSSTIALATIRVNAPGVNPKDGRQR